MSTDALDWQKRIYLNGFSGKLPGIPLDFTKLELAASRVLSPQAFAYIAGGAGLESTIRANRAGFEKIRIVPRMLRNVGIRDTAIDLLGLKLPAPMLLAPVGVLELAHPYSDIAVARACATLGVPFIFSNQASIPMEECAAVMGSSPRWFQLYWSKSAKLVESFLRRAENCGCTAIVVTLDTTMLGWRTRDLDLGYLPFLEGRGIAQYTSDPVFQEMIDEKNDDAPMDRTISWQSIRGLIQMIRHYPDGTFFQKLKSQRPVRAVRKFVSSYSNPCTTWDDLRFLRTLTPLPILLKGILHPDDAKRAVDADMNGVIVSNHGGRQVDGAVASIDALPAIVRAVEGKMPVLLDSGVRGGADAFKAIALGASAVCIGRPYAYALALAGERGVYQLLRNYIADFELTMGLAGCKNVNEINSETIAVEGRSRL
ncbi:MAG TPA: lactate 2-monooxygenase [Chryseosolibacter sp.]|nr:lactate 2-monooxygenase [Chryseosolibacter sp.]